MANELVADDFFEKEFKKVFGEGHDTVDAVYFLKNYRTIMIRYIANGFPSDDTKRSYFSEVDYFLNWCVQLKLNPFKVTEQQLIYYRSMLINKGFKPSTVKFKLNAVRRFYHVAQKYKLVADNPATDLHAQRDPDAYLPIIKYLTVDQFQELLDSEFSNKHEIQLRTKTMIALMGLEGLRTVEVHRMNVEDISKLAENMTILIHGKGHNDFIYPSAYTANLLIEYINVRPKPNVSYKDPTPVFVSTSNRSMAQRISRRSIRTSIDKALAQLELKSPGISCHMLRHTCGTLLYASTHDIQAVKETLRHKSIEMTSKYAHVQDMMLKRYTEAIPILKKPKKK